MSTLTLDVGGLDMTVGCKRGGFAAPDLVGGIRRSFNGNARSFVRAELSNTPVVLVDLTKEDALTIRQLFAKGAQVVCNGEVFLNELADITVWGEVTGEMIQGGTWWELSMTLHEVSNADTAIFAVDDTAGPSTLMMWYDAQALPVLSDGAEQVDWPDESGNNYDATSSTGFSDETGHYATAAMNGFPAVYFEALGNNQRGYAIPVSFTPTEGEAFIVLQCAVGGGGAFWGFGEITTGPDAPATVGGTFRDSFGSTTSHSFTLAVDPTAPFVYHVRAKAGQWRAWINGTLVYSSSLNAVAWDGPYFGIWLSAGAFYSNPYTGWIGELKLYEGWMAPADATAEEAALMTKWGITP